MEWESRERFLFFLLLINILERRTGDEFNKMKLLEEKSFYAYEKKHGNYNVNVYKQTRMIHKKNGCHFSRPYQFIPFDTLEEIEQFELKHDVCFTRCQNPKCGFKE